MSLGMSIELFQRYVVFPSTAFERREAGEARGVRGALYPRRERQIECPEAQCRNKSADAPSQTRCSPVSATCMDEWGGMRAAASGMLPTSQEAAQRGVRQKV